MAMHSKLAVLESVFYAVLLSLGSRKALSLISLFALFMVLQLQALGSPQSHPG